MPRPTRVPIGLDLVRTGRLIRRAFEEALGAAGGSLVRWTILLSIKTRRLGSQRELADAVGIRGATLTHHLNAMEAEGLLTRRADPNNRRIRHVELTRAGESLFDQLRAAVVAFDRQLRNDSTEAELASFRRVLARLRDNVEHTEAANDEWRAVPVAAAPRKSSAKG